MACELFGCLMHLSGKHNSTAQVGVYGFDWGGKKKAKKQGEEAPP